MNKLALVFSALAMIVMVACGGGDITSDDWRYDNTNAKIVDLQDQINDLQAQINELKGAPQLPGDPTVTQEDIDNLQNQIDSLELQIVQIEIDLADVNVDLDALNVRVTNVENSIVEINNQITLILQALEALQNVEPPVQRGAALFTGVGAPTVVEGALDGDFYIDLVPCDNGSHLVYILTEGEWVPFGEIFRVTGSCTNDNECAKPKVLVY